MAPTGAFFVMEKYKMFERHVLAQYGKLDNELSNYKSVCYKGCSNCCYQPIEIMNSEIIPIVEFLKYKTKQETLDLVCQNIVNWAKYFNKNYKDSLSYNKANKLFLYETESKRIACPFLINNCCSIYKVRPIVCRAHLMFDTPKYCAKDGLRDSPNKIKALRDKYLTELMNLPYCETVYLPVGIAIALGYPQLFKDHETPKYVKINRPTK